MNVKQLFEASRHMVENSVLPQSFSEHNDTWIQCVEGNVRVRWVGDEWIVSGTRIRAERCDTRDLRYTVRYMCDQLGGTVYQGPRW